MQFKNPEILYALLLLIIPIIVHLFQLQRFVKVPFTNVKFLKNIQEQTRKSSRIKKWLILVTRMLAFTCLIFAFSQPYFSKNNAHKTLNTNIYLDNSFSMQAKGEQGEMLKNISQQLIENTAGFNNNITLITNSENFKNLNTSSLKNQLINIPYAPEKLNLNTVLLQLNKLNYNKINTLNKNILISDFQNINIKNKTDFTNVNGTILLLKTTPKNNINIFIDSVYIESQNTEEIVLNVQIKSNKNNELSVPVSLLNGKKLIGKATVNFNKTNLKNTQFSIPNTSNFSGTILLNDNFLEFDNEFFFTISNPSKINVLSIGKNNGFLAKIYTKNEFNFSNSSLKNLNYNVIQNQQIIILNELENIPTELSSILVDFEKNGGDLVIIPALKSDLNSYNKLFNSLKIGKINGVIKGEHKVTFINYEHPLINNVFEKKVENFQYPTIAFYYNLNLNNSSNILKLDNNTPFISSINKKNNAIYIFNTPLNKENTDFTQSSLVVPIFYNFAKNSLQPTELSYTIKPNTKIDIKTTIGKDEVLKIANDNNEFIPLQNISKNKVTLDLQNNIKKSGFYTVLNNNKEIQTLAFNYNRNESDLTYANIESLTENLNNVTISSSIDEIFEEINNQQKINWLFKWFLAFSVLFLLIEMLILKYFKI